MAKGQPDYMNVTLLKGQDTSGNLLTIAVDDDGNLIGLLKGEYAGVEKTLAVDSQGRMLAVLTDPEDVFGNPNYMGAAELAVRQGSIVNFDRRGNVVWMDDFEASTLKWTADFVGTGGSAGLSTDNAKNGDQCIKLVAGSDGGRQASLWKWLALPRTTRFGFEISMSFDVNIEDIIFQMTVYDGTNKYFVRIKIDVVADGLYYWQGGISWGTLASSLGIRKHRTIFYTLKFVFDTSTWKWVRVLFQDEVFDLSDVSIYTSADAGNKGIWAKIEMTGKAGSNAYLYLDDFILTQNEP